MDCVHENKLQPQGRVCIQQAQLTFSLGLTLPLVPAEQNAQQTLSLDFLSHWFCTNEIPFAPSVKPLFAKVDGEKDQTCGLTGEVSPLGLFLLKFQITEHADP